MEDIINKIISIFGIFAFIKFIIFILKLLYRHFILREVDFKKKYGNGWCIITGGSSGIGFSYAKQFLKRKFKILLISSNIEKLKNAKDNLLKLYPNSIIEILAVNLAESFDQNKFDDLKSKINEKIKNEDISILINNAGKGKSVYFSQKNVDDINYGINIYAISVVFMTKICMENMLKRTKYKSLVIQSGSFLGKMRLQNYSIYSASKSFIEAFNCVLSIENLDKIDFSYIEIGPVDTKLNKSSMPFKISPDEYAEKAIKFMGNYEFSGPICLSHEFLKFIFFLPFFKKLLITKGNRLFKKKKIN